MSRPHDVNDPAADNTAAIERGRVHGQVTDDAIEDLKQELAATNVLLIALQRELASDRVETAVRVEGLRAEQARERRVRMMAVTAGVVGVTFAYDQQVEHCSPGSRVTRAVDHLIRHPSKPTDSLQQRSDAFTEHYNSASPWCDVTMPLHTHDGSDWPTPANWGGGALLGVAALATAVYHRIRTRRDFARVAEAARVEENHNAERT